MRLIFFREGTLDTPTSGRFARMLSSLVHYELRAEPQKGPKLSKSSRYSPLQISRISLLRISRRSFLAGLISTVALGIPKEAKAALSAIKPFSFAFVSDTHLATGTHDTYALFNESQLFLQDVVKTLNHENLDFVIFGGDQVHTPGKDDANWNLFIDVLQNLNCQWNFVLGEDDVSGTVAVDKMRTYGPDWKGKGIETNLTYWSSNPANNVHLIGLDTSRQNTTSGVLSSEQLAWLKEDLGANPSKLTIVFSHHPLLAPPPYDGRQTFRDYALSNGDSAREILASSPDVRMAISGHVPINKVQKEGNIYYISAPSLIVYPCAFKIFRVNSEEIVMETHQVSYRALIEKAQKALIDSTLAYHYDRSKPKSFAEVCAGGRLDWDAILPMYGQLTPEPFKRKRKKK